MYTKKEIGYNIKLLRLTKNMTQKSFAKIIGIARTTLAELETGSHVTFKHILNISKIFNVDLYSLTAEDDIKIIETNLRESISPSSKKVKVIYDGYVKVNDKGEIKLYSNQEFINEPICNIDSELGKLNLKKIRISIKEY
jgi:transcriptional regulator with XRE-family HTH domain